MIGPIEEKLKKPVASAAIFFDESGKVLIVKNTYKNHWSMPGGGVEDNESPADACVREIKEELSLIINKRDLKFLSVDYVREGASNYWNDAFRFVFLGGVLDKDKISSIKMQESEIEKVDFVEIDELTIV